MHGSSSVPTLCYEDLAVGTFFLDAKSFKHALRSVAIKENFGVRIKASDKKRVIATCSYQGCKWRIRASLCEDDQTFEVRRLDGVHTCPGINRAGNRLATSSWVANEIKEMVKRNPDLPPKDINNNLEKEYGLSLPYMKLWRSREQARDSIFGSIDDNYKWVPTLHAELIGRNPGSHITYMYDQRDNSFQRFYVSFKVCTDGFMYGCRPLISLDACHLKSKHLGMLLSATSLDGNNGLFPLAFAVVETESKKTWLWFLHNLGESIGTHIEPLAFISDMEKGLGEAIKEVYPGAEHRICIRHLWKNIKKNFHCKEGLPCIHAIAFIGMKEHPIWHTYVHDYYYVNRYMMAYDGAIAMLPGKDQWQVVHDMVEIGVPNTVRPRGRPKRRRLPSFLEKDKKVHKCSRCNLWGHHRSTCKNPLQKNIDDVDVTQVSQEKRQKLRSRRAAEELGDEYEYAYVEGF